MAGFYDRWLATGDELAEAMRTSPGVSHDADRPWEESRQDAKVKLMLADELGFPMMGGVVLKAEIPVGAHTGRHVHGEEAIFVLSGTGFVDIRGHRFDVRQGSAVQIPYRADHRLVNTGDEPLLYVSALAFPLERFVKLASLQQLEDWGPNTDADLALGPESGHSLPEDRRVIIHLDEAPMEAPEEPTASLAAYKNQHYNVRYLQMRTNGFAWPNEVAMTHVFEEPAGYHAGRHQHLEAVLYVLDGDGYSEVDGVEERWAGGDVLHVPPSFAVHEHYNLGEHSYRLLRIQFGIRYFFTDIWPEGYTPRRILDEDGQPIEAGWIDPARAAATSGSATR